jgi:phosphoglycerate dehydrogenase-like enzyme
MTASMRIHFEREPKPDYKNLFESLLSKSFQVTYGSEIISPESVDYLISHKLTKTLLESCIVLKAVIIPFVGAPELFQEMLAPYPHVHVHNIHHNTIAVAENTAALLLAAAKHLIPGDRAMRSNDWSPRYSSNLSVQLSGKNALILGYGSIGQLLAKILSSFDMNILATRNSTQSQESDGIAQIYPACELHNLLPQAQFLINILPLTPSTEGLLGSEELALLPKGAVVVNTGRGKVIDQDAFYKALKSGQIGSAGIDVWYNYPTDESSRANTPPADHPFYKLENVVMSPHRAGGVNSVETEELRMHHLADLLNHAARGEALPNRVDLDKEY